MRIIGWVVASVLLGSIQNAYALQCSDLGYLQIASVATGETSGQSGCNYQVLLIDTGGTLNNSELFNAGEVNIYGILSNTGNVTNDGLISNYGLISNTANFFNRYGQLNNHGTITNTANLFANLYKWGVTNNFSGGVIINNGTLSVAGELNNSGSITNNGSIYLQDGYTSSDGIGHISGSGTLINNGSINTYYGSGFTTGKITNNGTITIGGWYGSSSREVNGVGNITFQSSSGDSSTGTLSINGNLTQNSLNIQNGTLNVSGSITSNVSLGGGDVYHIWGYGGKLNANSIDGDLVINDGGFSNGLKEVSGNVSMHGGKIAGAINVGGNLLTSSSDGAPVFDLSVNGIVEDSFDKIHVKGSVFFSGGLINLTFGNYKPVIGDSWKFLTAGEGLLGFETLSVSSSSSLYYDNLQFVISSVDDDLILTLTNINYLTPSPVPESDTYAMLLAGLGVMGFVARRKQS